MKYSTIVFCTLIFISCTIKKNINANLMVGVAAYTINPDVGAFIAGDAHNRKFTGIHDSIYVKAIVLSDSKNHIALLTFDCIGLLYPTLLEIRKEVALKISPTEFDPSHIVTSSTHTHSGPDVTGIYGPDQMTTGIDTVYMKKLVQTSVATIVEAWHNRKAATMQYAATTFGEEWVYNISEPAELDRSVNILQFVDSAGKSIATLTNFACHPTFLDGVSTLVSADYVGSIYKHLDQAIGGVNFFLQGPSGGWIQPEHEPKTFESADKRGRELGVVVESALKSPIKINGSDILYKSKIFKLPVSNKGFQQLAAAGVVKRNITDSVTTEVAWFSLGTAQFVTHPAETVPAHSLESKRYMKMNGPKFVLEIGMDGLGYIVKPSFFDTAAHIPHSEYLTRMSVDSEAGPILMKTIKQMAEEQ